MSYEVGSRVGDYEVLQVLGAGGMGCVYKVRNVISDRVEAMKVLLPDLERDPDLANRFMREIKVQASLVHPNIAALHTALRIDNQLLMLMEYVEGVTLENRMESGAVPIDQAVDYIAQVLSALSYAHGRGVVHRDIKPANMMITPGGVVKLMDFGIAKMTATASSHRPAAQWVRCITCRRSRSGVRWISIRVPTSIRSGFRSTNSSPARGPFRATASTRLWRPISRPIRRPRFRSPRTCRPP